MKPALLVPALLVIVATLATGADAQPTPAIERRLSATYKACMTQSDGVTAAMMDCSGNEIGRQDAALNQACRMVMQKLPARRKAALRESERRWIPFRDATCRRQSDAMGGGTSAVIGYPDCILTEITRRTLWLERYR